MELSECVRERWNIYAHRNLNPSLRACVDVDLYRWRLSQEMLRNAMTTHADSNSGYARS
jgi:hypothetical protein